MWRKWFYTTKLEVQGYEGEEIVRIGILSMQRVHNYGSFLQSYALKKMLENMGHNVVFVDIECSNHHAMIKRKDGFFRMLGKLKYLDKYLFKRIQYSKKNALLDQVFLDVQKQFFDISEERCIASGCDAVVVGSDEIFNCEPNSRWGVTGQRFGDIKDVPIVFSYAASCGYTQAKDVSYDDAEVIGKALQNMKVISVRDKNTADFIKFFSEKVPEINLDPVLIYDFEKELNIGLYQGIPNYAYMVVYAYHNRIEKDEEIRAIKAYAKKHRLKTIAIGGSLPWCDEFAIITPFQVLAYFKKAKCVVTDTFHGTIIAAKYNKPLAVLIRGSNANKLGDLLERIDINNHCVTDITAIEKVLDTVDNFSNCNEIVRREQKRTNVYLDSVV